MQTELEAGERLTGGLVDEELLDALKASILSALQRGQSSGGNLKPSGVELAKILMQVEVELCLSARPACHIGCR
jgi:hypothetical protein